MSDPTLPALYQLDAAVLPASARVAGFVGREALGELYRLRIGVLTAGEEIDLAGARGLAASLRIDPAGGEPLPYHGMIAEASLRHAWAGQALYELVVVPKVWAMTLTHYCRVFVDMSVVDIVKQLFEDSGITTDDYQLRLQADHPPHPHTCQYKESRWAFLSRLMEREGLYYFFEHGDSREKLIITDHRSYHDSSPAEPVRYLPLSGTGDAMSAEALHTLTARQVCIPRELRLRDFDYLKPALSVQAEASMWERSAAARVHHGEHDFRSPAAGAPLARVEAEAWQSRELGYHGRGRVFGLRAGYRFTVEQHPLDSMNRELLAVEITHGGCQAAASPLVRELLGIDWTDDYRLEVRAIDAAAQYRPGRRTPVPRISGVERAFVDGPADSDYAQIDEHGRYHVKLHFDIDDSEQWDGEASTWLRMLQPHGGTVEGFHFPLRKNTEVMVLFLGGDPDRPVIAGAVPNAVQPSPVTQANHTQNVVQTGGKSRIEIEDQEGKRYVDVYTPPKDTWIHLGVPHQDHSHYITFNTEADQLVNIGGQRDIEVGGPQNEHVKGAVKETFDTSHTITVTGPRDDTVTGVVTETYHTQIVSVETNRSDTVSGGVGEAYGSLRTNVTNAVVEEFGSQNTTVKGNRFLTVGSLLGEKAGVVNQQYGSLTTVIKGPWSAQVGAPWTVSAPVVIHQAAGSYTIMTPTFEAMTSSHGDTFSYKWEAGVLALAAVAIKAEAAGVSVTRGGADVGRHTLGFSCTTFDISIAGAEHHLGGAHMFE